MQPEDSISLAKKTARSIVDHGSVPMATLKESILLKDKVEETQEDFKTILNAITGLKGAKGDKGEKGDSPSVEELVSVITPLIPEPIKGDSYILTERDKKDIAKSITVPVVEKVVEKTEFIVEKPIVTVKEVAIHETAEEIADKLNSLNEKIDSKAVKGIKKLEEKIIRLENRPIMSGGGIAGVSKIIAGSGVTISPPEGRGEVTINASGGGGSLTKGIVEVDFGAITTESDIATVSVADATVTATSYPSVSLYAVATTDHDPDDYMAEGLVPYVTNVQAGVGFDVSVRAPSLSWGKYMCTYQF